MHLVGFIIRSRSWFN